MYDEFNKKLDDLNNKVDNLTILVYHLIGLVKYDEANDFENNVTANLFGDALMERLQSFFLDRRK